MNIVTRLLNRIWNKGRGKIGMEYLNALKINLSEPSFQPKVTPYPETWTPQYRSVLDVLFKKKEWDPLTVDHIKEKIRGFISSEIDTATKVVPGLTDVYSRILLLADLPALYIRDDIVAIPSPKTEGLIYLLSNNTDHGKSAFDELIKEVENLKHYWPAISKVDVLHSEELAQKNIQENQNVKSISEPYDFQDNFEQTVFNELQKKIGITTHNISVQFTDNSNQEFDILVAVSPDLIIPVEATDVSGTEDKTVSSSKANSLLTGRGKLRAETCALAHKGANKVEIKGVDVREDILADQDLVNIANKITHHIERRIVSVLRGER